MGPTGVAHLLGVDPAQRLGDSARCAPAHGGAFGAARGPPADRPAQVDVVPGGGRGAVTTTGVST